MKDEFQVLSHTIEEMQGILHLEAVGLAVRPVANHKLRILAVFTLGESVRRFPMETECIDTGKKTSSQVQKEYADTEEAASFRVQTEATAFQVRTDISLPDIFYRLSETDMAQTAVVHFEYCDAEGVWNQLPSELTIEARFFMKQQKKKSVLQSFLQKTAYVFFTILLPVWVLDGCLAAKGYKKSAYVDGEVHGKTAVFYHAQGIVKKFTGYGYSIREIKTNYFAKKYKKACRSIQKLEGILFLSERAADKGGNLDLIRAGVLERNWKWSEMIDTRAVHKLPFSKLRKTAVLAAGAKVIVLEDFYPQIHALSLRKETKLLQLWHACGAFKMFGLSDIGKVKHLEQNTKNHRNYSSAFVSGSRMIPFYSEAFGIAPNQVLPYGVPRTDIFFDKDYKERVCKRLCETYPLLRDKKVVLFAPTFRGSGKKGAYYPMERFSANDFLEKLPQDVVLVVKQHPFVTETLSIEEKYENRFLDLSGKENINDLLFVSSLLITDYSSCIFEASLLNIPMLFYVFDLDEYVSGRDIYFDFASFAPGPQVKGFDELIAEAEKLLENGIRENDEKNREFCDYFMDSLDGHSTERILDYIETLLS